MTEQITSRNGVDDFDDIAVVLPVYKCAPMLRELCDRLVTTLSGIAERFSIVFVDDCSPDNAWEIIQDLCRKDTRIRGLRLSRNFGQHYALTAGLDHCRAKWYVVMDSDLQDAPEDIPILIKKAREGYDVVVGAHTKKGHGLIKRCMSRFFYWLFRTLSGLDSNWDEGNFRIFSETVARGFRQMNEQLRFLPATFSWMGFSVVRVPVSHSPRMAGGSSYTFSRLLRLAFETVLAHSETPLRMVAAFGLVVSFFAVLGGILIAVRALVYGTVVSGWASLMVTVAIMGGIQIFLIGIVGIYVGKTFNEAKKRPLYLVRSYCNLSEPGSRS